MSVFNGRWGEIATQVFVEDLRESQGLDVRPITNPTNVLTTYFKSVWRGLCASINTSMNRLIFGVLIMHAAAIYLLIC